MQKSPEGFLESEKPQVSANTARFLLCDWWPVACWSQLPWPPQGHQEITRHWQQASESLGKENNARKMRSQFPKGLLLSTLCYKVGVQGLPWAMKGHVPSNPRVLGMVFHTPLCGNCTLILPLSVLMKWCSFLFLLPCAWWFHWGAVPHMTANECITQGHLRH